MTCAISECDLYAHVSQWPLTMALLRESTRHCYAWQVMAACPGQYSRPVFEPLYSNTFLFLKYRSLNDSNKLLYSWEILRHPSELQTQSREPIHKFIICFNKVLIEIHLMNKNALVILSLDQSVVSPHLDKQHSYSY